MEKNPLETNQKEKPKGVLDFLEMLGDVTEEDINSLEKELSEHGFKQIFDQSNYEKKAMWALVHKLPAEDLETLYLLTREQEDRKKIGLVGFHDFRGALQALGFQIKNPKYDFLNKYVKKTD